MPTCYHPSIFWKSKYKTAKQKGYQGTDYHSCFNSKRAARAEANKRITQWKRENPTSAKHLIFSAHVVEK